jgi:hypothetical protein
MFFEHRMRVRLFFETSTVNHARKKMRGHGGKNPCILKLATNDCRVIHFTYML